MAHTQHNLTVALTLAEQGFFMFPCRGIGERRKEPCYGILSWRKQSTRDPLIIREWWRRWPDAVPAIDLDKSGLLVLDGDCRDGRRGIDWAEQHIGKGVLDCAPGSDTPSGGRHSAFRNRKDKPLGNGRGRLPPKSEALVDIRGEGGYVLAPGALFADGGYYAPRGDLRDALPIPESLLRYLIEPEQPAAAIEIPPAVGEHRTLPWGESALAGMANELRAMSIGEGCNDAANRIAYRAGRMVAGGLFGRSEAYRTLSQAALSWGIKPNDRVMGQRGTIARALRDGAAKGAPITGPHDDDACLPPVTIHPEFFGEDVSHETPRMGTETNQEQPIVDKNPPEIGGVFSITATPYVRVDPASIPRRLWLYGNHLIRQFCSATIAHGAAGKSNLLILDALAMVTGRNLRGIQPPGKLKVWYWNGEDPMEELQRRIEAVCLHYGISPEETNERLFVDSGRKSKIIIAKMLPSGKKAYVVDFVVRDLKATLHANAIDVLIIDPFIKCHEATENDNNAIDLVANAWSELADDTNVGIDLAHHSKKTYGKDVTVDDSRGASALLAAVRSAQMLNAMTSEEANNAGIPEGLRKRYFRVTNGKLNLAPPPEHDDWCFTASVDLGNGEPFACRGQPVCRLGGDSVGVVTAWQYPDAKKEATEENFAKVAVEIKAGKWRKDSQAQDWAGKAVAKALGLDLAKLADMAAVKRMLKAWLNSGALVVVKGENAARKEKDFIEVAIQPDEGCTDPPQGTGMRREEGEDL